MKESAKKRLKTILPILLGLFLVWYSLSKFTDTEINNIKTALINANYWWIALSVGIGFLSHFSRAYRWKFTLAPLGYKAKLHNRFFAVAIGYLVNLGIPRAGEFVRATTLNQYEDIPYDKAFGTIVAERLADMIVYLFIIALALFAQYDLIIELLKNKIPSNPLLLISIASVLVIIAYLFIKAIQKSEKAFFIKVRSFVNGLKEGVTTIFTMEQKWSFIGHTLFIWLSYILMLYVVIFAFPETQDLSFNPILICFVLGTFSYAATNGGIGSYPLAIQTALLLYNVDSTIGASFGWIMWSAQTLLMIVLGGLSFLLLPICNKSK